MTTRRAARAVARLAALASLIVGLLLAWAGAAGAHPLGNFTVNQYTGLRLLPDRVRVDYVLDMAEIPAFQTRQEIDADGDQKVSAAEAGSWRLASCPRLAAGRVMHLDGQRLDLATTASRLSFPPGSGGLPTLQALLVASTVTLTHTAGVLALGVALSASTALAPERIYPWLGLASGLLLASVGVTLLRRAVRAARPRHAHGHPGDPPPPSPRGPRPPPPAPRRPATRLAGPDADGLRGRARAQPLGAGRAARSDRARPRLVRRAAGARLRCRHGDDPHRRRPAAGPRPRGTGPAGERPCPPRHRQPEPGASPGERRGDHRGGAVPRRPGRQRHLSAESGGSAWVGHPTRSRGAQPPAHATTTAAVAPRNRPRSATSASRPARTSPLSSSNGSTVTFRR